MRTCTLSPTDQAASSAESGEFTYQIMNRWQRCRTSFYTNDLCKAQHLCVRHSHPPRAFLGRMANMAGQCRLLPGSTHPAAAIFLEKTTALQDVHPAAAAFLQITGAPQEVIASKAAAPHDATRRAYLCWTSVEIVSRTDCRAREGRQRQSSPRLALSEDQSRPKHPLRAPLRPSRQMDAARGSLPSRR